jgi:hypothetical protein
VVITAGFTSQNGAVGIYRIIGQNDEASTSLAYSRQFHERLREVYSVSEFWKNKFRFHSLRQKLGFTASLPEGWNTYGSEAPNDVARSLAAAVLDSLERGSLPPSALTPSSEGGIAIAFVNGAQRAFLETYNTGEIVAATYSPNSEPAVWEFQMSENQLQSAIDQIRVHLSA